MIEKITPNAGKGPDLLARVPGAIAVVGASPGNFFGRSTVENLLAYGFAGAVLPVNTGARPVAGISAYASVEELPCDPDLGVVAVRAEACLEAVTSLAARGCTTVVVLSDGFSETGTEAGRRREGALAEWCRRHGVVLLGPNGVGFCDMARAVMCVGIPVTGALVPGPVSVVSQSGGVLSSILAALPEEGTGVDLALSIGNGAGFALADALEACLARPGTQVIAAYVESVGTDVGRLTAALDALEGAGKRVLVVKPGRTPAARRLVASHTASLTGPDELVRSLLAGHGVGVVDSVEHLVRAARAALVAGSAPDGRGVAVVGAGGGAASLAADLAAAHGVSLARYSDETMARLRALVPASGHAGNPLDLSGGSGGGRVDLEEIYGRIARDPSVGILLLPWSATLPDRTPERELHRAYLEDMAAIAGRHGTGLVVSTLAPQPIDPWLRELEARHPGTAVVRGLDATLAALGALGFGTPGAPDGAPGAPGGVRGPRPLDLWSGRQVLERGGLAVVDGRRCPVGDGGADRDELMSAGDELGYPVAVKGLADGVAHKAPSGAVALGVASGEDLARAVAAMAARLDLTAVVVERMVTGVELLVGCSRHPLYGPFLTLGLGGVLAETTPLHATAPLPLGGPEAVRSLCDRAGITAVVAASPVAPREFGRVVSRLCSEFVEGTLVGYDTVEVNPLFLTADGRVLAADALVVPAGDGGGPP